MIDIKAIIAMEKKELQKDYPNQEDPMARLGFNVIYNAAKTMVKNSVRSIKQQSGIDKDYDGLFYRMFEIVAKELLYENTKKGDRT